MSATTDSSPRTAYAPSPTGAPSDIESAIARYTSTTPEDGMLLVDAGLDSLTVMRLVAEVATDPDVEIDVRRLSSLRCVKDLKDWLSAIRREAGR